MAIIRYLDKTAWPFDHRPMPRFWIHSTNLFAASVMVDILRQGGFSAISQPYTWKEYQHGVVAGAFDVIHPGYVLLLEYAKSKCHKVTVLLHDKPDQVFGLQERASILLAMKYVDDVVPYETEDGLTALLEKLKPDVRIVGSDHKDETSRPGLSFPTIYHERNHDYSATRYKQMIAMKVSHADSL
jgi:glycerol-3-phosphate cytidylyltransferase